MLTNAFWNIQKKEEKMAERRMFAKIIIDSDAFLDMPSTTQLLYFHLAMRADDDGFINSPKSIMRVCAGKDDDLKILISKKFIIPFESGIVVIKHWKIHNYIRSDRYKETKHLKEKMSLEFTDNNSYRLTSGIPLVDKMDTQVRLGKVRLGKDKDILCPFDEIIDFLNSTCNKNFKKTITKTKDLIKARFNEGFNLDDFKKVIKNMQVEWGKDEKMNVYLRPETLFGNKFESYLNREEKKEKSKIKSSSFSEDAFEKIKYNIPKIED